MLGEERKSISGDRAVIVTALFGLAGGSADYISRHLKGGQPPKAISLDTIAKVSGRIERMARETLPRRQSRLPMDL